MFALRKAATRANAGAAKRFASTHYGPEEPLTPYVKWVAAVSAGLALITYDRYYTDGAISRRITPASNVAKESEEGWKSIEAQWKAQERSITLFDTRKRTTHLENFALNPVPVAQPRSEHTSDVLDVSDIGERRPRSKPHQ